MQRTPFPRRAGETLALIAGKVAAAPSLLKLEEGRKKGGKTCFAFCVCVCGNLHLPRGEIPKRKEKLQCISMPELTLRWAHFGLAYIC